MAFSSNGASNGTITTGNTELLKGDSIPSNLITGSVPISQTVPSPHMLDSGMSSKKNRHDDEEQGKLFVGGLSWDTAQDSLLQYFSRFGEVIDCVVMKNAETGRSRGFGFVTFSDPANVDAVIASCPHTLDGRTIDPKSCNPRSMQKPKRSNYLPKIFLGGLPSSITETDLRSFFTKYGEVCEVVIMYDQEKKKSRGFGFLSFADESACSKAVSEHFVNIQSKQVEIKRAEPRTIQGTSNNLVKDVASNMSQPQWSSMPNGHPRHLPTSYGVPNVPPSQGLANHSSVSVLPPTQNVHGWGVTPQNVPPPIHGNTLTAIPPTGAHINHIMPPQTPPHPPPAGFPTHYSSPATTPHVASPVTPNWLHPPPIPASRATTTTPQPFMPPNNWASNQHSSPHNKVPTFPSPLPVASPVNPTAQTTPFPGATAVYPHPSTPQPSFWGMVPVPTPPPTSQTAAVASYASPPPPPPPIASSHAQLQPNVAFSQYGGMTVSGAPLVATPVPPPVAYSVYQQNSIAAVHPGVSSATQSPVKPYPNSSGIEFIDSSGSLNHNCVGQGSLGGMIVAGPTSAAQISQQPLGAASGIAAIPSSTDLNAPITGSLGPQRGLIYNPPSQIQGYHPYRRM